MAPVVERLGERYEIEERIGSGGMGEVFRARDLRLERTVAVKCVDQLEPGDRSRSKGNGPFCPRFPDPTIARPARKLEQTYTTLADNEEWPVLNASKIVPASDYDIVPTREDEQDKRVIPVKDDERIPRCLSTWAV